MCFQSGRGRRLSRSEAARRVSASARRHRQRTDIRRSAALEFCVVFFFEIQQDPDQQASYARSGIALRGYARDELIERRGGENGFQQAVLDALAYAGIIVQRRGRFAQQRGAYGVPQRCVVQERAPAVKLTFQNGGARFGHGRKRCFSVAARQRDADSGSTGQLICRRFVAVARADPFHRQQFKLRVLFQRAFGVRDGERVVGFFKQFFRSGEQFFAGFRPRLGVRKTFF